MAAFSTLIGAAGAAATAVGTGMSVVGAIQAQKGEKRAERLRQTQMNLESARERRNIVRQAAMARASALVAAESQGAEAGTGLQGGLQQIAGTAGQATAAVNQNQDIGTSMFAANRQISRGNTMASVGSGISSLGGGLVQNSEQLGRLGNYAFGRPS